VDVIQFLNGEEARVAYEEETGDPGGPPDDYYIKNENARLRTLPLDADVQVTIDPDGGRPTMIALADLPDQLASGPVDANGKVWYDPFWLTVEHGAVTAMEEQFLP
jgi:hypothetical protein